ncbi:putative multi-domain containing protein [Aduncisulcus paluster]|uniref:Multi-domain containing protein n=1 Tax=Aduncisulcus paluster TaxID=2918883 RepID=A0ABQ5JU93_9EUKA|nr:putative multi-domain containing protein [Aduncisulcus paluster]
MGKTFSKTKLTLLPFRREFKWIEQELGLSKRTIHLWSDEFDDGKTLTTRDSPSLYWDNVPDATESFLLMVTDYDAPGPHFRILTIDHWILTNIGKDIHQLEHAISIEEMSAMGISFGDGFREEIKPGMYLPPRPIFGTHKYYFRIFALDCSIPLNLVEKEDILKYIDHHVLSYGEIVGTYNLKLAEVQ